MLHWGRKTKRCGGATAATATKAILNGGVKDTTSGAGLLTEMLFLWELTSWVMFSGVKNSLIRGIQRDIVFYSSSLADLTCEPSLTGSPHQATLTKVPQLSGVEICLFQAFSFLKLLCQTTACETLLQSKFVLKHTFLRSFGGGMVCVLI